MCDALSFFTGHERAIVFKALRRRKWLDGAPIVGCITVCIDPRKRLVCRQLFFMRALDVLDSLL